jgi:hypothetical protein
MNGPKSFDQPNESSDNIPASGSAAKEAKRDVRLRNDGTSQAQRHVEEQQAQDESHKGSKE